MGVLPWANWFYGVGEKRDEVNALHSQALSIANDIQDGTLQLNSILQQYRALLSVNQSLLVSHAVTVMPDQDLTAFKAGVEDLPPMPQELLSIDILQVFSESAVFGLAATLLWNGVAMQGKILLQDAVGAIARRFAGRAPAEISVEMTDLAVNAGLVRQAGQAADPIGDAVGPEVSEDAAKAVFGTMTAAELALTGLGIFAAVGIDAAFGALEGKHESDELDKDIADLQTCVDKAHEFQDQLNSNLSEIKTQVVQQENTFVTLVRALESIRPANFTYDLPLGFENLQRFLTAQQQAFSEYGVLADLRLYVQRAQERQGNVSRQAIIDAYMIAAPPGVTAATAGEYWDILARYSDAMQSTS